MTGDIAPGGVGDASSFEPTPQGWARRWQMELSAARKALERWHTLGGRIIQRFRDERDARHEGDTRWNLFTANIQTQRALMFGQTPRVTVSRRHADARDDAARVASEMLERLLNLDIERDDDSYAQALSYALDDRLLVGMGNARVRYVARFELVQVEARLSAADPLTGQQVELAPAYQEERKVHEDVEVDYLHWRDQLWGASRVFHEVPWWAHRSQLTREQLIERFGEELGRAVPLNARRGARSFGHEVTSNDDARAADPWSRADVWEIWSKEQRTVFWFVEGFDRVLDMKEDPLGLDGFWPFPRPMAANLTTDAFVPRPDFVLAQDLYDEIDTVSTRITLLERAVRVAGVYDKASEGLQRLLSEATNNELIPVDNWALHAERGGLRGCVDWLPLEQIVSALTSLRDYRRELVDALYQVTGMSDILRGQAAQAGVTATEQRLKAGFGSVRMQALQDEFARFASELQKLKAEVISKHFDAATILERSNIGHGADAQLAPAAVELLKSRAAAYRVEVKPEAVSLTDFAALRAERTEVLTSIAGFLSSVAPLMAQQPAAAPYLLQILQWSIAGLRGASTMEGVLDQAIAASQQAMSQPAQPAPADPKLLAAQVKAQADLQKVDAELRADLIRTQAEVAADAQREQDQAMWNVREAAQKHAISRAAAGPFPLRSPPSSSGNGGIP